MNPDTEQLASKVNHVGFVQHVFNFDNDTKNAMLNVIQYLCLAIIPVALLNKGLDSIIPEADHSKGNIELLIEVVGNAVILFFGIFLIHRLITFVPTYSGRAYGSMNLFNVILFFLVISYDMNSSLGAKMKILLDRVEEMMGVSESQPKQPEKANNVQNNIVTSSQPISGGQGVVMPPPPPMGDMSGQMTGSQGARQDFIDARVSQADMSANMNANAQERYMQQNTPPASSPHQPQHQPQMEPMAANEGFSSFGGSAW